MIRLFSLVLALMITTTAGAAEWCYEDGNVPIAWFDNGSAQLQFACRGGDLTVGYWVRSPHREVAGATKMNLAITPDPAAGTEGAVPSGSSFAQDMPLIHSDGASMIIRGPVAQQWARIAQRARDLIRVAYVRPKGAGGLDVFDSHAFGAKGSSAAIRKVLDRCG